MRKNLTLFIGVFYLLLAGCCDCWKKSPSYVAQPVPTENNPRAASTCQHADPIDFAFRSYVDIKFCVDNTNHTISIYHKDTCKQTLLLGDTRKWYVYRTGTNVKRFVDTSSPGTFGTGTVKFPMGGTAGVCNKLILSSDSTGNTCRFLLIGTDDIRDLDGIFRLKNNIYNNDAGSITKYIEIGILHRDVYETWIKQSLNNVYPPADCNNTCQNACIESVSCPTPVTCP